MNTKKIKSVLENLFKGNSPSGNETNLPPLNKFPFSASEKIDLCEDLEKKIQEDYNQQESEILKTDESNPEIDKELGTSIIEQTKTPTGVVDSQDEVGITCIELLDEVFQNEDSLSSREILKPESLLTNSPFIKLVEECSGLMDEFEGYASRLQTDEGKVMTELVIRRMQELLERSGVTRIDQEVEFSILRHIPVPNELVTEGTAIEKTLEPGLAVENRVIRKAKVKIVN